MKLVLLDSHALIHRAYHAIPLNFSSANGEPTNATFGFASTILKVLSDEQPECIAATFDVGPSFRQELYADYKGTRPELQDDLRVQLHRSRDVVEALGIPTFGLEKYEADDLLGTLARQASAQDGVETLIVTGDTDILQLVGPRVRVLMFSTQVSGMMLYDEAAVVQRYQLKPRQLIDFKAIKGDVSDNIPGIPGIGEKTATKLLQSFGTLEGIYANLDKVEPRWRTKLTAGKELAFQGKKLVTIVTDAPVQLELAKCRVENYDRERAVTLFRELGFRRLLDRLPGGAAPDTFSPVATLSDHDNYHTADTDTALDQLVARLRSVKAFVLDVETTGTDAMRAELVGLAIGVGNGEAYYVPVKHDGGPLHETADGKQAQLAFDTQPTMASHQSPKLARDQVLAKLKPVFEDDRIAKYAHNAKYDATIIAEAGVDLRPLAFDSMLAASLIEPTGTSVGLKNLAREKFGVEMTEIESLIGKGKNQISMAEVDVAQASRYACADADYTYRLVELYEPQIADASRGIESLFRDVEMPLVPVLVEIERAGVLLDLDFLAGMSRELTTRLQELEKQITAYVGSPLNIASPTQLGDALFNKLKLPTAKLPKTKTGQISTAADVLETLRNAHPIIPLILEHRELSKLKGTYVDALPALVLPRTGRVHTDYNQFSVVTGRLSSSNPNLQNIPIRTELGRRVRRAFLAPKGCQLISADYSQVELRILAHVSRDVNMLEAFARGDDIHAATASRLFNTPIDQVTSAMRRLGKTINFGIVYGITDYGVAARTDLSQADAKQLIENYFAQYAGVKTYLENTKREARERGYVETLMGRRRYFPELRRETRNPAVRNQAEREAINHPIQGSAAEIIKLAMVRLHRELHARELHARMILQVHDELVLECPDAEAHMVVPLVRETMENASTLDAKLKVDIAIGQNWDDMKTV